MRLTIDEIALLKDRFEEFVDSLIGQDVQVIRNPDTFKVDLLRKMPREPLIRPQLAEDMACDG